MKQKILSMLELQDAMNSRVNPDWREAGYAWYRAIWTECAEMLDHYGWKWWKHQKPDMEQVHLELIDIWHFALSDLILKHQTLEDAAQRAEQELGSPAAGEDFREMIERMAMDTIAEKSAQVESFAALMRLAELDFDSLFKTYVGKNVLNFFRQDHGYKDGTYVKTWHGREDNEHLAGIVAQLDADAEDFQDAVYRKLAEVYPG